MPGSGIPHESAVWLEYPQQRARIPQVVADQPAAEHVALQQCLGGGRDHLAPVPAAGAVQVDGDNPALVGAGVGEQVERAGLAAGHRGLRLAGRQQDLPGGVPALQVEHPQFRARTDTAGQRQDEVAAVRADRDVGEDRRVLRVKDEIVVLLAAACLVEEDPLGVSVRELAARLRRPHR